VAQFQSFRPRLRSGCDRLAVFDVMPELKWGAGYPWAILLMVLSAALPFLYFKRRGWL